MRALRKGKATIFNLAGAFVANASIVERVFGVGPSAFAVAATLRAQYFEVQTEWQRRTLDVSYQMEFLQQSGIKCLARGMV